MSFDLGNIVPLRFIVTDPTGAPANGGTVTLTITQPDATSAGTFTLTPTTVGTYDYDFIPTQGGRHLARCVSTGVNASAYTDAFNVDPADPGGIVSLADVKAQLNLTSTRNDVELRFYIETVTNLVEHEIGPVLIRTHTEVVSAADTIVLAKAPVVALTSLVPTSPNYGGSAAQYLLDGPSGILRRQALYPYGSMDWSTNWNGSGQLTATYTAGRAVIPAPVRLAAMLIISSLWESQRGASAMPLQGGESGPPNSADAVPAKAIELLAPYRRAPVIA